MSTRLTDRDLRMLVKCAICRWLTTTQLHRLYFPKATLNAVQKRLRTLSDTGYLCSHREHPTAEAVHALGPKGKLLVEEKGVNAAAGTEVPQQLAHLIGVNEIRIAVETSSRQVAYFFSYWQLSDMGWNHGVIPDAIFAIRAPDRRTFMVEYDRSTETLKKLLQKLRSYDQGLTGFPFDAVLIVTERTRRLDLLTDWEHHTVLSPSVLALSLADIDKADFFASESVELPGGARRKIS
jgi:Replication-relaxation